MSSALEMNQRFRKVLKKLVPSLVVNLIVPWVIYICLRYFFDNDAVPLAIASVIPVIRNIVLWVWRHRIDWIGVLGVFGFVIAFAASLFFGGSSLPIKLIHPIIFGIIGLAFLFSVVLGRPLLITILPFLTHSDPERFNGSAERKKFSIMTAVFGGIALLSSVIHITMALELPTSIYLPMSHVVSWVTIIILVVIGRVIAQRINWSSSIIDLINKKSQHHSCK